MMIACTACLSLFGTINVMWEKVFFCFDGVGKYPKVFYGFTVLRFCKISEWTSPNVNYYYLLLQSIRCRTPGYGCTVPLYV